ncbi:hypothetical protein MKW94_028428 [Papaver nudicaule]|uniref:DUF506 family protein n=1 Tax=Papaver nudicaule TaxID=74823 RepID=A0AA42B0H8_PAPNU|nr:hypothetical protein [Papaver nudicaule]
MERNPGRFKRVAEAFNEAARICAESSGSEHSAVEETSPSDLSDLVNSFLEMANDDEVAEEQTYDEKIVNVKNNKGSSDNGLDDSKTKDMLKSLLLGVKDDYEVKREIHEETELAYKDIGISSSEDGFKRLLMTRLRQRGFDAGLCKSRWEKTSRFPAGTYEYVDVIVSANRYIVEVFLSEEFTIARPTNRYTALLGVFPRIYVGKPDQLKHVVRIMCRAGKQSLNKNDMHIPPWRTNGYMQAKWLSLYKRTINSIAGMVVSDSDSTGKRSVGFDAVPAPLKFYFRRDELERRRDVGIGKNVGKLAQLFI